jgi:hypothetical protein
MLHDISRRLRPGVFLALAILCLPVVASAGTINVILSGVDVIYLGSAAGNTGSIYDSIGHLGGNLMPAESSEVNAAVFEFNMVDQGMLMSSGGNTLYGDLKVDGVGSTLPLTYTPNLGSNGGGFGFDWFDTAGHKLRLGINKVDVLLTPGVFFFTGTASVLPGQNLPFGLAFDTTKTVSFSYTATLPGLVGINASPPPGTASGAMASGAFTISGPGVEVPETATMLLSEFGVVGLAIFMRRCDLNRQTVSALA